MSRIGKQPIVIPEKTEVAVSDGAISVKGPLGELSRPMNSNIAVEVKDRQVVVTPLNDTIAARALWGTYASHISNMIRGVNEAFGKKLIVEGT